MSANEEFYTARIEALERENKRLNDELKSVKEFAFKLKLSDPNFDKPLSKVERDFANEIDTSFEVINAKQN